MTETSLRGVLFQTYKDYIFKSPRYTRGDLMFLYRFVRRHRRRSRHRRPQILVHAITFKQLFGFLSFLARLLALNWIFQGQIWNLPYLQKMAQLPRNEKQTYQLNSRAQM